MSFTDVSESTLLYALVIGGIAIILAATIYYLIACARAALNFGMTKGELKAVIKSSVSFSILPSLAVVAGLIGLVAVIGIPYGWFRLSVIGSVSYELMASDMALGALNLNIAEADAGAFGLMMWSMCLPITASVFANLVLVKPIHLRTANIGKPKDKKWKELSVTVFMTSLMVVLVIPFLAQGSVSLLTFLTSSAIAIIVSLIAKKFNAVWLNQFTLAICLIGAMAASVLYEAIL